MTSDTRPKNPPTPAPRAASRFDDNDDADFVAVGKEVAVAVVVNELVFVFLENVEADAWPYITDPSAIVNGDLFPSVLLIQV